MASDTGGCSGPRILEWLSLFARASLTLRGLSGDLVHAIGPSPPIMQAVDLATLTFDWAGFDRATAASGETRRIGIEALGRRMMVRVERSCYGAGRARVLSTLSDPARRDIEELLPGSVVALTPEGVWWRRCHSVRAIVSTRSQTSTTESSGLPRLTARPDTAA